MADLNKVQVPVYTGKNPTYQGKQNLVTKEGLLVNSTRRVSEPNEMLLDLLGALVDDEMSFEAVGTGLKIGRKVEDRLDSVCVIHNVGGKNFGVYVLKRHPEALPERKDFVTDGEPIKGANSKSSRVTIPFEGNTATPIATFIKRLPTTFESGRITTFNHGKPKKVAKPKKPKAEVIDMPTKTADGEADKDAGTVKVSRRKKKKQKQTAVA
jgi:hypothetical protein